MAPANESKLLEVKPIGLAYKSSGMLCVPEGLSNVLVYPLWNERTVLYATERCKFTPGRDRAMCYLDPTGADAPVVFAG